MSEHTPVKKISFGVLPESIVLYDAAGNIIGGIGCDKIRTAFEVHYLMSMGLEYIKYLDSKIEGENIKLNGGLKAIFADMKERLDKLTITLNGQCPECGSSAINHKCTAQCGKERF